MLMAQAQPEQNLSSSAARQADSSPPCRQDRPLEEYLVELKKSKKQRNKNPLPSNVCIFAWCPHPKAHPNDPSSRPPQAPPAPSSQTPEPTPKTPAGESSSQPGNADASAELRGTSLYNPIEAARNVEAGDYYFGRENYRAALSRFQEALQDKPDDASIQSRLGKVYEKLDDVPAAYEHFDAALILLPDGPAAKQAREGLERLRPQLAKTGADPAALHERNAAAIAASCH